ncbi:dephospho-CoA kinase [Candidatus Sumerlaeota bacterium]|nr:dephospho-CoA kinase [Candidatus Sumerlaeota bacterium]
MPVIGLTGSFGSGKTTVAEMFQRAGARVADADVLARHAVEPGSPALKEIVDLIGQEILQPDGQLNRAALAERIFGDESLRQQVNAIIHPRVRALEIQQLEQWRNEPLVVLCVPLLLENQMEKLVDHVVVVTVDEATRTQRLGRLGLGEEQIAARLKAQMPQGEKIARADFVIDNSGSLEQTERQALDLVRTLLPQADRSPL